MVPRNKLPYTLIYSTSVVENKPASSLTLLIPHGCDPMWHPAPAHKVRNYNRSRRRRWARSADRKRSESSDDSKWTFLRKHVEFPMNTKANRSTRNVSQLIASG